jgi:hypothetical protein
MSNMEAMCTEQNSLGLLETPSDKLFGDGNSRMEMSATPAQDVCEIRPRKDRDGFDLVSDRLRYGPIWYADPMQSAARSRTRSTVLGLARTGRSSACLMKRAT